MLAVFFASCFVSPPIKSAAPAGAEVLILQAPVTVTAIAPESSMSLPEVSPLQSEWIALQHDHEAHERTAVAIKVTAVVLCGLATWIAMPLVASIPLLLVLWAIEAVARTVQARLGDRLLRLETLIADAAPDSAAFRLHCEWLAGRPGLTGLLREYARAAIRPTVAFPYAPLLILMIVLPLLA